jgi:DNA invertase Pin-like site-specific DNA recombinase
VTSKPARVVAYTRVSTADQADHGVSLEAQRAKLEAYAKLYELDVVAFEVDAGVSAKTLNRPGLARALEALTTAQADGLLVVKMDRLTRSVRDLGELIDGYFAPGKWALLSVSEQIDTRTAGGRLVLNVLGAVSQWEREVIGERTSAALQHKKACGEFTGGKEPPYGHMLVGGHLQRAEAEQAIMWRVRTLRLGGNSFRSIARHLDKRGDLSRSGKPFAPEQLRRMVK